MRRLRQVVANGPRITPERRAQIFINRLDTAVHQARNSLVQLREVLGDEPRKDSILTLLGEDASRECWAYIQALYRFAHEIDDIDEDPEIPLTENDLLRCFPPQPSPTEALEEILNEESVDQDQEEAESVEPEDAESGMEQEDSAVDQESEESVEQEDSAESPGEEITESNSTEDEDEETAQNESSD